MRLQTKFILSVAAVLFIIMGVSGWCWQYVQETQFDASAVRELERTQAFLEATRSYAADVIGPAMAAPPGESTGEAPMAWNVVHGVFDRFAKSYPNYRYKEAADNPLDPAHQADGIEMGLLLRLRASKQKQITTFITDATGEEWFVGATPVVAEQSCLQCHGSATGAPAGQVNKYGTEHGYGWKAGDVVAAVTVRVPTRELRTNEASFHRNLIIWFSLLALTTLIAVYVCAGRFVCVPVQRMGEAMEQIAADQEYGQLLAQAGGKDELATAARAFNHVLSVVRKSVISLSDINNTLEQRVKDRTAELAQGSAEIAAVNDTALDCIILADHWGRITGFNPAAERTFGCRKEQAVGRRLAELIRLPHTDQPTTEDPSGLLLGGETSLLGKRVEVPAQRFDGNEFPAEVAINTIATGGAPKFVAYLRDITERKRAEQETREAREAAERASAAAVAASHAKSDFLANMSHEIRTPLNGVCGMIDLLQGTQLSQTQQRFAGVAKSSAQSLLSVINDVLDFSKIEAGKLELSNIEFDLTLLVEDVVEMLAARAGQKGLELAGCVQQGVHTQLRGDPDRLRQILINLVTNAIKFTEQGEIILRVAPSLDPDPDQAAAATNAGRIMLRLSVTDSGIGIPQDRIDRLFRSFSQVDASTTRKYGGTGLGLAICKQLAELMGGQIGVESQCGHGSTFWFTARFEKQPGTTLSERKMPVDLRGLRVLAVDDNAVHREILQRQLANWGFETGTAADGSSALATLQSAADSGRPYALAIVDYGMPDMDGVHLAREIQKIPELAHTPLIMITGLVPNLGDAELKAAGFRGVLTKPIRQSQAFDTIIATVAERTPDATDTAIRPTASPRPTSAAIASQRSAARLLLAEDNEINQMVAIEVLHRAGFRCDVVSDGQKAVEAAISGTYQVVMMDCQMPTCDGFEAARRIRAAEQQVDPDQPRRHVPIVALTANAIKGDREKCLAAGMDNYMTKPLDPKRLVQLVDFYLGIKGEPPAAKPQAENEWADEEPRPRRKKRRRKIRSAQVPGDAVPIEWDSLFERCMKNTKFVQQMLSEFQAQGSQSVEKIRQSVTARDADQTAKLAHSLKGVAAYLSARSVRRAAAQLEELGLTGNLLEDADTTVGELVREMDRCLAYIPKLLAKTADTVDVNPLNIDK